MPRPGTPDTVRLFAHLKAGNQEVHLRHEDLHVTARPGYDPADLPRGRWAWACPRDEHSVRLAPGQTREEVRRRDPGLARTGNGVTHIFSGDAAISVLSFDGRGGLDFRRRVVQNERRVKEQALVREHGPDHPWLRRQEETRYEGGEPITEAGPRETANTHPYPLFTKDGPEFLMCNEAGRPYRIRCDEPGSDRDLSTIGPLGTFDRLGNQPSAPWFRNVATSAFVHLVKPDFYGKEWPMVPNAAEIGMAPDCVYFPYFRYHTASRHRREVRYRLNGEQPLRRGNHRSRLYVVQWDPRSDKPAWRTAVRDASRPGAWAQIDWGTHQALVTERWFIVCDSGFVVDSHSFERIGPDDRRHRTPGDPEGSTYRGAPPLYTTLWFIDRRELDKRPRSVAGIPVVLDNRPSIHAYTDYADEGGRKVTLWLNGNRWFDASEWIRAADTMRGTGTRVPKEVVGLPVGDHAPAGFSQEVYRLTIDPLRPEEHRVVDEVVIPVAPGTILAAEPPVGTPRIPALFWVSIGTWPELETREHAQLWCDFNQFTSPTAWVPARPAAVMKTSHDATEVDDRWEASDPTWLYGAAYAQGRTDPREGWVMGVGLRMLRKDEPGVGRAGEIAEELYVFDSRDLAGGPAFVIRARDPKNRPLRLGFGIHGGWLPLE